MNDADKLKVLLEFVKELANSEESIISIYEKYQDTPDFKYVVMMAFTKTLSDAREVLKQIEEADE